MEPALTEVLGKKLSDQEMYELRYYYLGVEDMEQQVSEQVFIGICAFCERIYANYSLEDNDECHTCYKIPTAIKHECHQNKKNHLEKVDLSYLYTKLKDGQVQKNLSHLFLALCNKD